jgi:hypothetical protein
LRPKFEKTSPRTSPRTPGSPIIGRRRSGEHDKLDDAALGGALAGASHAATLSPKISPRGKLEMLGTEFVGLPASPTLSPRNQKALEVLGVVPDSPRSPRSPREN